MDLVVLSGDDEARLTFLAVRRWFGWSAGGLICLDIGGGSFEFSAGIGEVRSSPTVAARCRPADPRVVPADPPSKSVIAKLREHLDA